MRGIGAKFLAVLAAACLSLCGAAEAAWNSEREIMRLKDEVPSMEIYDGNDAVIWLRNDEAKLLPNGVVERMRAMVIMMGEKVPDSLKTVRFPVPTGGEIIVEDAAWYNTMLGMKEGNLRVTAEVLAGGAAVCTIKVPDDTVGRAVVIAITEITPAGDGVSGTINMAGEFPIWEQNVSVEVPYGTSIYWKGRDIREPTESFPVGTMKYRWTVMNQLPWRGEGFVVNERPLLSYSTEQGVLEGLHKAETLAESVPDFPLPNEISPDDRDAAGKLIAWVNSPERTLSDYPPNWVRASGEIPPEGPWTRWEQTFLIHKWLKTLGWESDIWWNPKMYANASSPAAVSLFEEPVLELKGPGTKKASYFTAGLPYGEGRVPFSLAGTELYSSDKAKLKTRKLSIGSASSSTLGLLWTLKLGDEGKAEGRLDITVTGGWNEMFFGNEDPTIERASEIIMEKMNFAMLGMNLTPTEITEQKNGYRLRFDVTCTPGIVHGNSLLLRLPGGVPMRVGEMIGQEGSYTLRFPFIIDQKVRMSMPRRFRILQDPPLRKLGEGTNAALTESITHWSKRGELLADSQWVVKTREVEGMTGRLLREELSAMLRWPVLNLPFRK